MAARRALKQAASSSTKEPAMRSRLALRATIALRPARSLQFCQALLVAAVTLFELKQRHAGLNLNPFGRHIRL